MSSASQNDANKVQSALDALVLNSLPTAAGVIAGIYTCFVFVYWYLLPPEAAELLTICAVVTIVAMVGCQWALRKWSLPQKWTYPAASALFAVVLANHAVHLVLSPIPQQAINTAVIIIALGLFSLSFRWMIGSTFCSLAVMAWAFAMYAPNTLWGNQLFVLVGAVAVSIMVLTTRRKRYIELFHIQAKLETSQQFERTLHSIAMRLLAAEPLEVAAATDRALKEVRECTNTDAAYIVQVQGHPPTLRMLHECQRDGSKEGTAAVNGILANDFPWFWYQLQKKPVFAIDCVDDIPPEGAKEQALYRATGVQAFLAVPLMSKKGLWGYLGLVSKSSPRKWSQDDVKLIQTLGRNYLIAIDRQSAHQEIENLTERLFHASRLISAGEMSAAWFHQQRTLFQSSTQYIRAAQNFLKDDPPALDRVAEVLSELGECCESSRETLSEFLRYIKTGETERERWSMRRLVKTANQLTRHQALEYGIQIDWDDNDRENVVCCSGNLIVQVIVNLVLNAVEVLRNADFSEEPAIRLTITNENEGWVELSVADNGPGVPPHLSEAIFQRFFTTRKEGFGIGLFIGRKILEAHGGRLDLNTTHRNGCEFVLKLPLAPETAPLDPGSDFDHDGQSSQPGPEPDSDFDGSLESDTDAGLQTDSHVDFELEIESDETDDDSDSDSDSGFARTSQYRQ